MAEQEQVLSEITHELGNFFHKLYYWTDYLKDETDGKATDATAVQMLERTIRGLEDFLRLSLDYFHPVQLSPMRMSGQDVAQAVLSQVQGQLNGTPVSISERGQWKAEHVVVDPSQLSRVFEVALRRVVQQLGPGSALAVVVSRATRRNAEMLQFGFRVEGPAEASTLFQTSEAGVAWALAQKVMASHGGGLVDCTAEPGEPDVVVYLPLCSPERNANEV